MGKGANRIESVLEPSFQAFRTANIGLQPLFFFGFPREDDSDRQATVDLLLRNSDVFSTITKGGIFELLPGSIIAKNPDAFGVAGSGAAAMTTSVGLWSTNWRAEKRYVPLRRL